MKMGAPKGNKYALGNKGGAPPYFDANNEKDIVRLQKLCEEYFDYIKGEHKKKPLKKGETEADRKYITVRAEEPPTVTGLTLYLGFSDKKSVYDYAKKKEFFHSIKRALTIIEHFHEIKASTGDSKTIAGNLFILKNFGWKDTHQVDHTTKGKEISERPRFEFVNKTGGK